MKLTPCSSCGRLCAVVVVLEHARKGEKTAVPWVVGACCWSTPKVEPKHD